MNISLAHHVRLDQEGNYLRPSSQEEDPETDSCVCDLLRKELSGETCKGMKEADRTGEEAIKIWT